MYPVSACTPGESYVIVGDSGLCCCVCVTSFERSLTPLCAGSFHEGQEQH